MRWYPDPALVKDMSDEKLAEFNHATWLQLTVWPMVFYAGWVLLYYLLVSVDQVTRRTCLLVACFSSAHVAWDRSGIASSWLGC